MFTVLNTASATNRRRYRQFRQQQNEGHGPRHTDLVT